MIRPAENSPKIRDYVESLFRHKKKLLLYNLILLLLTTGIIFFWPRQYRSEAKIWIKIGRENSRLDPTAATGETISIQENDREDEIKSVLDIVASRGVVTGVVDRLGPLVVLGEEPLPGATETAKVNPVVQSIKKTAGRAIKTIKLIDPVSDREEAIQEIIKHVEVDSQRKSNVVSIQYDTDSPELAQAVVDALINQYTLAHARIHATRGSRAFFDEQRTKLREQVAETSEALKNAKDRLGIASIDGQRTMLEDHMLKTQQTRMDTLRSMAQTTARIDAIKKLLTEQPNSIKSQERSVPNTGRDLIRNQLYALQVRRMEMETKMRDHPLLDAIKKQEAEARLELSNKSGENRTEVTRSINVIHRELKLDLTTEEAAAAGHQAMLAAVKEQEQEIARNISTLNRADVEIKLLEREVELAVTNYRKYAENLEDARIGEALDQRAISNISVAQKPTLEEKPVSPSKALVALLGLFGMLFGSIAIALGAEMLDNSVRRPQDVSDAMDAPVLAAVPDRRQYRSVLK